VLSPPTVSAAEPKALHDRRTASSSNAIPALAELLLDVGATYAVRTVCYVDVCFIRQVSP